MYDIITIGTATQDVFLRSKAVKHLKNSKHLKKLGFKTGEAECFALGSKIELDDFNLTFGGGANNSAITFARQGFKTAALVKIGSDTIGENIIKNLKNEGVTPFAIEDKKRKSAYSTVLLLPTGERTILVYRGAAEGLIKREIPIRKLKARWAYISPGTIPLATMKWLTTSLKRSGTSIAMNPSKYYLKMGAGKLQPVMKNLDVVLVNREEASYLTGVSYQKEKAIFRKLDKMVEGIAVMTDGPKGALVSDGRYIYRAGIYKEKKTVDRTGAGDAFGSGFVAGLMRKNDVTYALKLASANATSVVEQIGAQAGVLTANDFKQKRFKYLDLDIEPLI